MEEHIEPINTVQTEFDEWVQNGLDKAKDLINSESDVSNVKEQ